MSPAALDPWNMTTPWIAEWPASVGRSAVASADTCVQRVTIPLPVRIYRFVPPRQGELPRARSRGSSGYCRRNFHGADRQSYPRTSKVSASTRILKPAAPSDGREQLRGCLPDGRRTPGTGSCGSSYAPKSRNRLTTPADQAPG